MKSSIKSKVLAVLTTAIAALTLSVAFSATAADAATYSMKRDAIRVTIKTNSKGKVVYFDYRTKTKCANGGVGSLESGYPTGSIPPMTGKNRFLLHDEWDGSFSSGWMEKRGRITPRKVIGSIAYYDHSEVVCWAGKNRQNPRVKFVARRIK